MCIRDTKLWFFLFPQNLVSRLEDYFSKGKQIWFTKGRGKLCPYTRLMEGISSNRIIYCGPKDVYVIVYTILNFFSFSNKRIFES